MNEFEPERKAVIDSLAIAGCTPIYLERQVSVDEKDAKEKMDEMVNEAEALILIYPRWEGKVRPHLSGRTPTQYEFEKFHQKITKQAKNPATYIHVFRKSVIKESEMDKFMEKFTDVKSANYNTHVELAGVAYDLGRRFSKRREDQRTETLGSMVVRYNGPDFRGLLERLSDLLQRGGKRDRRAQCVANIDRISFASGAGVATLYFSCSFAENLPRKEALQDSLNRAMLREIDEARREHRLLGPRFKVGTVLISVSPGGDRIPRFEIYLEVRTIDQPGQLHAIARVLREAKYNVDELQLKPAEKGYPRQTLMALWVSKESDLCPFDEFERDLVEIETAIRELPGVRSFSLRVAESSRY
jgi:hypothetical protein